MINPDLMQFHMSQSGRYSQPLAPGREPEHFVQVDVGVKNFCDPEFFATPRFEQVLQNHEPGSLWRYAGGIHPKKALSYTTEHWESLVQHLSHPRVVALSEVGLDHSVPQNQWGGQE